MYLMRALLKCHTSKCDGDAGAAAAAALFTNAQH